jgi:hypothetical protein
MIFAFFATPLGRKIGIGAAILLSVLVLLRWYGNRQYNAGRDDEKVTSSKAIEKAANEARDAARAELNTERANLEAASIALAQSRNQFDRDRKQVDAQINSRLTAIANASKEDSTRVLETPDVDLDALIRSLLGELRSAAAPIPVQ